VEKIRQSMGIRLDMWSVSFPKLFCVKFMLVWLTLSRCTPDQSRIRVDFLLVA
jgi:hypothetical protein